MVVVPVAISHRRKAQSLRIPRRFRKVEGDEIVSINYEVITRIHFPKKIVFDKEIKSNPDECGPLTITIHERVLPAFDYGVCEIVTVPIDTKRTDEDIKTEGFVKSQLKIKETIEKYGPDREFNLFIDLRQKDWNTQHYEEYVAMDR